MTPVSVRDRRDPEFSSIIDEESLDPNKHYRWVQRRSGRVARARAQGYRQVDRESGVRTLSGQEEDDGAGAIIHGDRVLMEISKEEAQRRGLRIRQLTEARKAAADSKFRENAARAGVKVADKGVGKEPD